MSNRRKKSHPPMTGSSPAFPIATKPLETASSGNSQSAPAVVATNPLTAKEETWIALAELAQASFFNRREIEWKIAFGLWTAIGAWTYFSVTNAEKLVFLRIDWMVYLLALLAVILFLGWQLPIRRAFEGDKLWKHFYMKCAIRDPAAKMPGEVSYFVGLTHSGHAPWTLSQTVVTLIFLAASWMATVSAIEHAQRQPVIKSATTAK